MNEPLCTWLEEEIGMKELAEQLRDLMRMRGSVENFVLTILKASKIYKESEMIRIQNVLEHLKNPKVELLQLTRKLKKNGELIIEVPNCDDALLSLYKNRAFADFTHWSCHLFMYNQKTLKMLLSSLNLKINYIKNVQRYSLMNHLYWLVKNKPGGHKVLAKYDFKILNFLYKSFLKTINKNDTIIISVSKSNMVL